VSTLAVSTTRLRSPRLSESSARRSIASNTSTMRRASRAAPARAMPGGLARRPVEIDRPRRIGGVDPRRQETRQHSGEQFQKRQEQQRQQNIEAGVKIGDGTSGGSTLPRAKCRSAARSPPLQAIFAGSARPRRADHRKQILKRDQHQAQPNPDPAKVARAGNSTAAKHEHAEQDEQKRDPRNIEGQHLDDQCRRPASPPAPERRRRGRRPQMPSSSARLPCCSAAPRLPRSLPGRL